MIAALMLLAFQAVAAPTPPDDNPCDYIIRNVWDPKFTPGQRWAYHSRPTDFDLGVTIAEIDNVPGLGFVVHVVITRIHPQWKPPAHATGGGQFAINCNSLDGSVTELIDSVGIPDVVGYSDWRRLCLAKTYATSVADTLTYLDLKLCEQKLKLPNQGPLTCKSETGPPILTHLPAMPSSSPTPNLPASATPPISSKTPPPSP